MAFFPAPDTDWYVDATIRLMLYKSCKGFKATTTRVTGLLVIFGSLALTVLIYLIGTNFF
ncbi:hypothetical protein OAJ20_04145 [Candidatus Pelagibacter sp.]|nr:hypothetical protein [Candidatus Pelagibacter sp.]